MWTSSLEVSGRLTDRRRREGQLYLLPGLLAAVFLASASNINNLRQMATRSGAKRELSGRLGFRRGRMPGYSTIRDALVELDVRELEGALSSLMTAVGAEQLDGPGLRGMAMDGKTLRGSGGEEGPLRLLSAVVHGRKWVLAEEPSPQGPVGRT